MGTALPLRRQRPRVALGRYPDLTLAKARELAAVQRVEIHQGRDVASEKQKSTIERAAAKTLRELAADYMSKAFPHLAANTIKQRHHIEGVILPKLGELARPRRHDGGCCGSG